MKTLLEIYSIAYKKYMEGEYQDYWMGELTACCKIYMAQKGLESYSWASQELKAAAIDAGLLNMSQALSKN